MSSPAILRLKASTERFEHAVDELLAISEHSPDAVQRFLESVDFGAGLLRIDTEDLSAVRTSEVRAVFEPSDALREFLSAHRAGDVDVLRIDVDHGGLLGEDR